MHQCPHCLAIFGQCYKGDSYRLVAPWMTASPVPPERMFYFDLTVLGSQGIERRHGWADRDSHLIVQVG